jgi:alginate O-acetyltransferase complex protein AlgI
VLFATSQYAVFFAVVFCVYWALPRSWRWVFLLLASYYFYASAIPQYLLLILALTLFNYALGLGIARASGRWRATLLVCAIAGNLGSLAYFKYTGLILSTLGPALDRAPLLRPILSDPILTHILLPIGISFFVFEFIHYTVEVFRGRNPIQNPLKLALFAAFFPTQIAGPIKRFPDFLKQLNHPLRLREVEVDGAVWLVLRGLLKKVVVADTLAPIVALAFGHPASLGPLAAWFAIAAFATQLYCDFSGYTDIGRGCAQLLGFSVPENFLSPYQSAHPAEFWRRWHISLSSWLRDYLYIPLGGSRVSSGRIYFNLLVTMALGGLWHGASWHFLVWGVYHGLLLCSHRLWSATLGTRAWYRRLMAAWPGALAARFVTLLLVCVGWVFFRASGLLPAGRMLVSAVAFWRPLTAGLTLDPLSSPVLLVAGAALVVVAGWGWSVAPNEMRDVWNYARQWAVSGWRQHPWVLGIRPALYALVVVVLIAWPPQATQRFIYFQF